MPESKKVVIKVDIHDENDKRKALMAVSGLSGIESLAIDLKDQKLTIVGYVDPVNVVGKLKKWHTKIVSVGPAKEEKKPIKKAGEDEEAKKKKQQQEQEEAFRRYMEAICREYYYNPDPIQRYCLHPMEEDPSSCVIC